MNTCVFCKIVSGDEPRHHVWEDDQFMAFLTVRPLKLGHLLIIPKQHIDYFFDMNETAFAGIFEVARKIEPILKTLTQAKRVGLAVEGFGVAHAHLHLIPMDGPGGLDSFLAHEVSPRDLEVMAEKLHQALI